MLTFTFAYKNRSQAWRKIYSLCMINITQSLLVSQESNTCMLVLYAKTNASRALTDYHFAIGLPFRD